jgi:hypothetical protein
LSSEEWNAQLFTGDGQCRNKRVTCERSLFKQQKVAAMIHGLQSGHLIRVEPVVQPAGECRAGFFVPAGCSQGSPTQLG